jgi:DNA-binding CsgD family transcriptional regulator
MQISIFTGETDRGDTRNTGEASVVPLEGDPPLFPPLVDLTALWAMLTSGECFVLDGHCSDDQCFLIVERRRQPLGRFLVGSRVKLLERILLGQSQKAVAIDFRLAVSTVALACSDCLRVMGRNHLSSRVPPLLVMAAHAAHGLKLPPARAQRVTRGHAEHWVLSAKRPDLKLTGDLTQAEEAVTRLLVEGHPHARIAALRDASPRTIANQLASAFRKLGISGRAELLSRLIYGIAEQPRPALGVRMRRSLQPAATRLRPRPRGSTPSTLRAERPSG